MRQEAKVRTPLGEARGKLFIGQERKQFRGEVREGVKVRIIKDPEGVLIIVSGEGTREIKDHLKQMGFRWDRDNFYWYWEGRELPQGWEVEL